MLHLNKVWFSCHESAHQFAKCAAVCDIKNAVYNDFINCFKTSIASTMQWTFVIHVITLIHIICVYASCIDTMTYFITTTERLVSLLRFYVKINGQFHRFLLKDDLVAARDPRPDCFIDLAAT